MNELNYIANACLQSSKDIEKTVKRIFRNQLKINRRITTFTLAMIICTIAAKNLIREQNKQIKKLSNEIEELNCTKGD